MYDIVVAARLPHTLALASTTLLWTEVVTETAAPHTAGPSTGLFLGVGIGNAQCSHEPTGEGH